MRRVSARLIYPVLGLLLLIAVAVAVGLGPVRIPISEIVALLLSKLGLAEADWISNSHRLIIEQIRLPRVLGALLIGWALATSGGVMQGIFRNPLASPYLLGIASGSSVGAAVVIVSGLRNFSDLALPIGAFLGGALSVILIYGIAYARERRGSENTLILAGIALGAFFSAITSFLIFLSGEQIREIVFWIMGSTARSSWSSLLWLAPVTFIGTALVALFARDLNALSLGDESAFHLGIRPERLKAILLGIVTCMTAAAVSVAGTIGFIGLITPHAMRLIVGPDQRILLPVCAIAGGMFLILVDAGARTIMEPGEIPVGVLSAFFGAPFFLYLLLSRRGGAMR